MKTFFYGSLTLVVAAAFSSASAAQTAEVNEKTVESKPTAAARACCAQGAATKASPIILALDIDKDGQISALEIKNAAQSLSALDANGDGKLSHNEIHAKSKKQIVKAPTSSNVMAPTSFNVELGMSIDEYMQQFLDNLDLNGNGKLEKSEMTGRLKAFLKYIDSDDDEVLTKSELTNMNEQIKINQAKFAKQKKLEKSANVRKTRRPKP